MRYYDLSPRQLEQKAEELLLKFDEERLTKIKPIDVYAVIDKCLHVPYDWKYLTPDQSVLGATAFSDGLIWVWPESRYYEGLLPYQVGVEKGTILIDTTLTEGDNRGRENFTVMHEIFHQVLHKRCFLSMGKNYIFPTYKRTIEGKIKCSDYAMRVIERQANACAAAFLMPAELTKSEYIKRLKSTRNKYYQHDIVWDIIKDMANDFSVSQQAMSYRLQNFGLINENRENQLK